MEWISVKDELPKNNDDVLIFATDCCSVGFINRYNNDKWCVDCADLKPTHWMPLPKPPKN